MEDIVAIQILALKSVEQPDMDYQIRRIKRWYSKEFVTPLAQVDDLDLNFLLQHYFEHLYSGMEPEQLSKIKKGLLYPELVEKAEADDEDWMIEELQKAEEALKKKTEAVKKDLLPDIKMEF